mmetsp:Transcript_1190/g.1629  ORF Transcript_1190/g.1629 Transcript_1190/m.1629 type:complete len:254 (-) Transcript_1190:122-883(-)
MAGNDAWMEILAPRQNLMIKEKVNLIEAASALMGTEIEMGNKYAVKDKDTGESLFYAAESTDCCTRQCQTVCPDCAPWNLDIMLAYNGENRKVFKMEKEWSLACCCFNRPSVTIFDVDAGTETGAVRQPCTLCGNLKFEVDDPEGNEILEANGSCCQLGLCLPLPCGPCSEVHFDISDSDSGEPRGSMTKSVPGCLKFLFASDVDNYEINFFESWSPRDKALMVALAIFMDFRLFNTNRNADGDTDPTDFGAE